MHLIQKLKISHSLYIPGYLHLFYPVIETVLFAVQLEQRFGKFFIAVYLVAVLFYKVVCIVR